MEKNKLFFRLWYYFRNGWSTYFAFILAAINTLTVTYYLAIDKVPVLQLIFPTFFQYVLIITLIGIPLLTIIGYIHYKKTDARRAEVDIGMETDPYRRRLIVNTESILKLNVEMVEMLLKILDNKKITEDEKNQIKQHRDKLEKHIATRTFNNLEDKEFVRKMQNLKDNNGEKTY